jgi:ferric-dicitrate binding protein FerR (iron transport regulator)
MMEDNQHTGENQFLGTDQDLLALFDGFRVPEREGSKEANWAGIVSQIEEIKRAERLMNRRFMMYAAASFALIISVSILLQWQFALVQIDVPAGRITHVMLPDSSKVTVNAASSIRFKRYDFTKRRSVTLEGEALFEVKKGDNPFLVKAGDNRIVVSGTVFNVKYRKNQFSTECLSGEVLVEGRSKSYSKKLVGGEGIRIEPSKGGAQSIMVDESTATSWTKGEFYFDSTPLGLVFEEMERQFGIRIVCKGFSVADRRYTGFFSSHNLTEALELVCTPMGLKYSIAKDSTRIEIFP